ncbi:citrate synthase family protein [Candidatus Leptofilum sp.]|uniref:citrate synthase family protein n=1 Tax=Candidatus Leptofilum sp. TaxID=3241576 RepID=UPI003B5BC9DF
MTNDTFMSAKEAATALEITLPTLYAYVSRGLIRSEPGAGKSRVRLYARADVEALLARKALRQNPAQAAETALYFGTPVLASAVTLIEDGRFFYRGHDVIELAQATGFESVASLLWRDSLTADDLFPPEIPASLAQRMAEIQPILEPLPLFERFQVALPLLAGHDLAAFDLAETAVAQTGARLLHLLTWAATGERPQASLVASLQQAWAAHNQPIQKIFNIALILCADHELNVSAFTARVVASTQANPYAVVQAGLAALQGARHGGHTERVMAFLREAGSVAGVRPAVAARLRCGERIPSFGHPIYPNGDPRGQLLLDLVMGEFGGGTAVSIVQELIQVMAEATGQLPTIDLGLAALAEAAGLPEGAPLALFALGRTAGWLGQAIEQYKEDQLIRPRARYVGKRPE